MSRFSLRKMIPATLLISIALLAGYTLRTTKAQDTSAATPVTVPADVVDQIMNLIKDGRSDDAISIMEGLKSEPDQRQEARDRLSQLHNNFGPYRGYDIAAIQRFTNQVQTIDVLAYYDLQPVLLSFHFYRPQLQEGVKWNVLGLQVITVRSEIHEALKDTPIEYVGRKK